MTKRVRILRALRGLLAVALLLLGAAGCRKEDPVERIELPATPVLTLRSNWAVVQSPFLRIRQEPLPKSEILAHLRRGTLLEIVSRTESRETVGDATDYWYQINYEGLRGWVFGSSIEVVDSRTKAENYARELR